MNNRIVTSTILLSLSLLSGCASTGDILDTPNVSLRNIEVTDLDFSGQTFVLGFDVTNPNPFPLPVKTISYGVELDGYRFAVFQLLLRTLVDCADVFTRNDTANNGIFKFITRTTR